MFICKTVIYKTIFYEAYNLGTFLYDVIASITMIIEMHIKYDIKIKYISSLI